MTEHTNLAMTKEMKMNWNKKRALVTGGASFIGSAVVDALVNPGAPLPVVHNINSRRRPNIWAPLLAQAIALRAPDFPHHAPAPPGAPPMDLCVPLRPS